MDQSPVIQFEVFHINFQKNTIEGVINEAFDRMEDGLHLARQADDVRTGIKTTIRFYDPEGLVLGRLHKIQKYIAKKDFWIYASRTNLLTNTWARWRIGQVQKRIDQTLADIRSYAQLQLKRSHTDQTVVAIQRSDFTFRSVKSNEWHDLIQEIRFGAMWIFAFEPIDLLQLDGLKITSHYMD